MRFDLVLAVLVVATAPSWGQGENGMIPHVPNQISTFSAAGRSVIIGDAFWRGRVGAGVNPTSARMEIKGSTDSETTFRVAGVDETPFLVVSSGGRVGMGVSPTTDLDISGQGGSGWGQWSSLALRNGNHAPGLGQYQITFGGYGSKSFRHAIRTTDVDTFLGNSLDLLLWEPSAGGVPNIARTIAASIRTQQDGMTLHIRPVGFAKENLVVSDGITTGGGLVHRRQELVPAGQDSLMDIAYLNDADASQAYRDMKKLRHVESRVARDGAGAVSVRPVYGSTPESIRRSDGFVSLDGRITQAELAAKELIRRLEGMEKATRNLGAQP